MYWIRQFFQNFMGIYSSCIGAENFYQITGTLTVFFISIHRVTIITLPRIGMCNIFSGVMKAREYSIESISAWCEIIRSESVLSITPETNWDRLLHLYEEAMYRNVGSQWLLPWATAICFNYFWGRIWCRDGPHVLFTRKYFFSNSRSDAKCFFFFKVNSFS